MEKAKQLAAEKGYCIGSGRTEDSERLIDPTFWKCLGKAMGWDNEVCGECGGELSTEKSMRNGQRLCMNDSDCWDGQRNIKAYKYHQYALIDHIDDGGSIEDFFNKLLNK